MIDKILDKLGIQLNPMQEETMHAVLHGNKDVVVLSPTGSGKTLAYLMPLVQLIDPKVDEPQLVVVTPGRELALQSTEVLKSMGTGLRTMACYGGRAAMDEQGAASGDIRNSRSIDRPSGQGKFLCRACQVLGDR